MKKIILLVISLIPSLSFAVDECDRTKLHRIMVSCGQEGSSDFYRQTTDAIEFDDTVMILRDCIFNEVTGYAMWVRAYARPAAGCIIQSALNNPVIKQKP